MEWNSCNAKKISIHVSANVSSRIHIELFNFKDY